VNKKYGWKYEGSNSMNINLNDRIRVKLTDTGLYVLKNNYKSSKRLSDILDIDDYINVYELDEQGYIVIQLWEFAHIFGKYLYMGNTDQVIEDMNVELLDDFSRYMNPPVIDKQKGESL
jgi:hypothetical protein